MSYLLPSLPYAYDALEPYLDKETMKIHHKKHHQNYVNITNIALNNLVEFKNLSIEELIKNLSKVPEDKKKILRNNAGGHANHSLFWKILKKGTVLQGVLKEEIEYDFGSVEKFKENFENKANSLFGSGWVWLVFKCEKLDIVSTANQDSPLMEKEISGKSSGFPIFGIDLWEHAYYLKFHNRRQEYIKEFWNVINWEEAEARLLTQRR